MKLKVARQLEAQQQFQSSGADYAHAANVPFLYTTKDCPVIDFAILPALPDGDGPGSIQFLEFRDEHGELTPWIEVFKIHEGFKNEFRNRTASPANWDPEAIDVFTSVQSAVYRDRDLRARLHRSGDLIQELTLKGEPQGKPKVPWSSRGQHYMNVRVVAGAGLEVGALKVLRVSGSSLTSRAANDEETESTTVWGLLDMLDQRDPEDPNRFIWPDPTNPDAATIMRLQKADPPTKSNIKWWRVAPTRLPKISFTDEELAGRFDLSSIVNLTSEETSVKHFYEFCGDLGGLVDVMEDLYPQFRPFGRDHARARARRTAQDADEIPGIANPRTAARVAAQPPAEEEPEAAPPVAPTRTPAGRQPAVASGQVPSQPAAAEAPAGRQAARAGVRRSSVGGAQPTIPVDLQGEVPPLRTGSMAGKELNLAQLLQADPGEEDPS